MLDELQNDIPRETPASFEPSIRRALRAGFTIEEIFNLTKIDRWFLAQIKGILDYEEELARAEN
jgi:Carbamoyl-phosphate synthetase large chain, oligomerisation domain